MEMCFRPHPLSHHFATGLTLKRGGAGKRVCNANRNERSRGRSLPHRHWCLGTQSLPRSPEPSGKTGPKWPTFRTARAQRAVRPRWGGGGASPLGSTVATSSGVTSAGGGGGGGVPALRRHAIHIQRDPLSGVCGSG